MRASSPPAPPSGPSSPASPSVASSRRRARCAARGPAPRRAPVRLAARGARGPSGRRRPAGRAGRGARRARRAPARRRRGDRPRPAAAPPRARARSGRAATCSSEAPSASEPRAQGVVRELEPRLQDLALEAPMQLGGFGLPLQRPQAGAGLALDVERAVEVLLRALELQLRAPAPLAVLAEARRLLDQQPPIARLGRDDRLDSTLRDDRVGLLAEARVGEHLDHVAEPAAGTVQPVAALAVAVETAHDRDLSQRQVDRAIGVVEHDLDLREAARLHAPTAAEDDVLHRLPAHGERRLLAHRPQDGVGHVGLAGAVGPDDDAHTRPEVEARAIGEGLEPRERERLQVHARPALSSALRFELLDRHARRLLLGVLLAASAAAAHHLAVDPRYDRVQALVRRAVLARDLVVDRGAAAGEQLLQGRLEVHGVLERALDLGRERLDDRLGGALVAGVQVARADHGLDHRGEHALGLHQRSGAVAHAVGSRRAQPSGQREALGDRAAGRSGHGLRADLRETARTEALGLQARVEVGGHREREHAVAEEGQTRVGVAAALAPRGMGEHLARQVLGELLEQLGQQHRRHHALPSIPALPGAAGTAGGARAQHAGARRSRAHQGSASGPARSRPPDPR